MKGVPLLCAVDEFTNPWPAGGVLDCDLGRKLPESRGARDISAAGAATELTCCP